MVFCNMDELITALLDKRKDAEQRLQEIQREIYIINQMIKDARAGKDISKKDSPSKKTTDSSYYMEITKRALDKHDLGLKTKELHHMVCIASDSDPNYNTFRSYLSRMKTKKEIYQDNAKRWHIKD